MGRRRGVPRRSDRGRGALLHRDPAAERHRGAPPRSCAQQHAPGHPGPLPPDAGVQRPVDAGHRSRRHRHPDRGGETAAPAGQAAGGLLPRGVRGPDPAVEGRLRSDHHRAAQGAGLLVRLGPPAVHDGPDLHPGGPRGLLPTLPRRPDLPRQAPGELGSRHPHRPRRRRGRDAGGGGTDVVSEIPVDAGKARRGGNARVRNRGNDAAGDDAGGRGGRDQSEGSEGRAVCRAARAAADRGPGRPDHPRQPRRDARRRR